MTINAKRVLSNVTNFCLLLAVSVKSVDIHVILPLSTFTTKTQLKKSLSWTFVVAPICLGRTYLPKLRSVNYSVRTAILSFITLMGMILKWVQVRRLNPLLLVMSQTSYHILYPA